MRKLLRNLFVTKGKREQDESNHKEISPADRVRALNAKREQDESGAKEITPADKVPAADEPQDLDPPSEENDSQRTRIWLKRYFGLSNWAWTAATIAVYEVWTEISAAKSGEGSFGAMGFTLYLAVVVGVLVFRDWLKPRRLSRVWRVLSITGVALVCSGGAFLFVGNAIVEWGSCVSGDCESGYGTFNYLSGDIYEGQWRNGQRGPWGTRRYFNGITYVGEWVGGAHGQGSTTWPNGDVYVGEHLGLRPWGTGTKTYADGRVESGQWVFGRLVEPE